MMFQNFLVFLSNSIHSRFNYRVKQFQMIFDFLGRVLICKTLFLDEPLSYFQSILNHSAHQHDRTVTGGEEGTIGTQLRQIAGVELAEQIVPSIGRNLVIKCSHVQKERLTQKIRTR